MAWPCQSHRVVPWWVILGFCVAVNTTGCRTWDSAYAVADGLSAPVCAQQQGSETLLSMSRACLQADRPSRQKCFQVPSSRAGAPAPEDEQLRSEVLKELLTNAGNMQDRQEQMDHLLAEMKKENEALWREVARLRQKHIKQQQIVEKLIQFLVTMVQANRNITVKRKMPLMLHDSPSSTSKRPRLTKGAFITDYQPGSSQYSEGPVIRDVTDLMEDLGNTDSTIVAEPMTFVQSPRAALVSTPLTPAHSSASPAACSDLDAVPVVSSPLSSADAMEPLCLLDAVQDVQR
ncbi:hypothetical protein HPB50_026191 [Hyalomma asiaticum]|uniref:Uncharacterized protein n=1 Tax=Hyalomma asiaticum TaxID=266040 RepID=A0ACB7TRE6_HYAAI|nr:hypothetical protein HPB50_026191 [Hyalomma asiaticum]